MNIEQMIWNIEDVYSQANMYEVRIGKQWYRTARNDAAIVAIKHGLPLWRVLGVVAALSPQKAWTLNIKAAESFIIQREQGVAIADMSPKPNWTQHCNKALLVLEVAKDETEAHTIIRGKAAYKTSTFFLNLLGYEQVTTIDRHALRIALADDSRDKVKPNEYMPISEAYIKCAKRIGIKPSELQAITWTTYRRVNNITA